MTSAADVTVQKYHASLNVIELNRSVAFWQVLFGCEPAKHYKDYAEFELDDPCSAWQG
jgi:hypothetical protein